MEEKKASEILLEVQQTVSNVETLLRLYEFQQKLILDKLNKVITYLDSKGVVPHMEQTSIPDFVGKQEDQESFADKKKRLMSLENTKQSSLLSQNDANILASGEVDMKPKPKNILISQRLVSYDGTPIEGAYITIRNVKDKIVKTTRANANGKWQQALPPGKYTLMITGKANGIDIDFTQNFDLPESSLPLELPSPQIYKKKTKI